MEAFGSKKKKKAMMSRIRNKIDSDDLEKSVSKVFNHMKNVEEHEEVKPSLQTIEYDILPQFNKDAKSPAMIYPLSSCILFLYYMILTFHMCIDMNCFWERI